MTREGTAIPTAARNAVRHRQQGQCARCGARYGEVHHRQRRREGGHRWSNLVGLCGTCHRWVHANPDEAKSKGYIVHIADNPEETPIATFMGLMLFDDDGSVTFVD